MDIETAFILLFVVATAVAIAARRLYLPYTVALVLAGLVLGGLSLFPAPSLTKNLLFFVFLPGLVFEAAFHIDFREFWRNRVTIVSLAVPGVVASTALIALILAPIANALAFVHGFTWRHALVFGALISATDPIAVIGLFRTLRAPQRLTMLLDGESLLNDGTGIVFFTLSLSLLAGIATTPSQLALEFLSVVGMGAIVGTAIGGAASLVMRQVDDPMIEITLTTIAAYGSFVTAETFHYSGVIATVAAGMVCGNVGARTGMSPSTRVAAETFWEYVTFALNSIVFLLIGLEVRLSTLLSYWLPILAAYLVVTAGRALVILAGCGLATFTPERFPWRWTPVLTWGGLRGALPMVLALSLPHDFAYRELIVSMTFGVVVLSILIQGVTMSTLLTRLGLVAGPTKRAAYELERGKLQAADGALEEIARMSRSHLVAPEILAPLREEYQRVVDDTASELQKLDADRQRFADEELSRLRRYLLTVEKDRVMRAFRQGEVGREAHARLLADIDARLLALENQGPGAPAPDRDAHAETKTEPKT